MSTLNVTNLKNEASASNNVTLDSNGRVGIGTGTPTRTLVVASSSGPNFELKRTGFSNYTYIEDDGTNSIYRADGSIVFQTGGVNERARVTNNGITFNGDTAAANALDDYEEGTWTPQLSSDGGTVSNYTAQTGYYRKIGSQVTLWFGVRASTITGILVRLENLPITVSMNGTGYQPMTLDSKNVISLETYTGAGALAFVDTNTGTYLTGANAQGKFIGGAYTYITT